MPKPIDPMLLDAMAEKDPELVQRYRERMKQADSAMKDAESAQKFAGFSGVAGQLATDFINSQRTDQIYHNRMQDLGQKPHIEKADRYQWDNSMVDQMAANKMRSARQGREDSINDMMTEEKLRGIDKQNAQAAALKDPNSEVSRQARANLKYLIPDIEQKIPGFESLSAEAAERASPNIMRKWDSDQRAAERRFQQQEASRIRRETKEDDRRYKEEQTAKANDEKKKTLLNEVEDRRTNINQNLDILDKMIAEKGTWEITGSHNQDMERLVEQIATDMAKLQDPSSVARPSEVEAVKKSLVQPGFQNRNATARQIIRNFRDEVGRRADNAYKIRGIEKPANQKKLVKKQYSQKADKTRLIYDDGTEEVVDGQQ